MASLRDLGSMNGTTVNGKKCGGREKGESPEQGALRQYPSIDLKNGDRITVGQSTIEVRVETAPDAAVVPAALPEGDLSGLSPEAMRQLMGLWRLAAGRAGSVSLPVFSTTSPSITNSAAAVAGPSISPPRNPAVIRWP